MTAKLYLSLAITRPQRNLFDVSIASVCIEIINNKSLIHLCFIGLWLTSVCENPFLGEWDEEIEDYKQPDWSRYWSLFDDLDASESGAA